MPEPSAALAEDFARALDPASLMREAGFEPDEWQANVLRSDSDKQLILASRQSGKSLTSAALALHSAIYDPGLVLLLAPALRQSQELQRKVREIHGRLIAKPEIAEESALRLEFRNGSRIIALPGSHDSTIRGYSAARTIIVDEAARVDDELFAALRPMLATSHGKFIAVTTPFGKRGWFWEQWDQNPAWTKTIITAKQCPRIDPVWLEEERRMLGEFLFTQEFECAWIDHQSQMFGSEIISNAFSTEVLPLWRN